MITLDVSEAYVSDLQMGEPYALPSTGDMHLAAASSYETVAGAGRIVPHCLVSTPGALADQLVVVSAAPDEPTGWQVRRPFAGVTAKHSSACLVRARGTADVAVAYTAGGQLWARCLGAGGTGSIEASSVVRTVVSSSLLSVLHRTGSTTEVRLVYIDEPLLEGGALSYTSYRAPGDLDDDLPQSWAVDAVESEGDRGLAYLAGTGLRRQLVLAELSGGRPPITSTPLDVSGSARVLAVTAVSDETGRYWETLYTDGGQTRLVRHRRGAGAPGSPASQLVDEREAVTCSVRPATGREQDAPDYLLGFDDPVRAPLPSIELHPRTDDNALLAAPVPTSALGRVAADREGYFRTIQRARGGALSLQYVSQEVQHHPVHVRPVVVRHDLDADPGWTPPTRPALALRVTSESDEESPVGEATLAVSVRGTVDLTVTDLSAEPSARQVHFVDAGATIVVPFFEGITVDLHSQRSALPEIELELRNAEGRPLATKVIDPNSRLRGHLAGNEQAFEVENRVNRHPIAPFDAQGAALASARDQSSGALLYEDDGTLAATSRSLVSYASRALRADGAVGFRVDDDGYAELTRSELDALPAARADATIPREAVGHTVHSAIESGRARVVEVVYDLERRAVSRLVVDVDGRRRVAEGLALPDHAVLQLLSDARLRVRPSAGVPERGPFAAAAGVNLLWSLMTCFRWGDVRETLAVLHEVYATGRRAIDAFVVDDLVDAPRWMAQLWDDVSKAGALGADTLGSLADAPSRVSGSSLVTHPAAHWVTALVTRSGHVPDIAIPAALDETVRRVTAGHQENLASGLDTTEARFRALSGDASALDDVSHLGFFEEWCNSQVWGAVQGCSSELVAADADGTLPVQGIAVGGLHELDRALAADPVDELPYVLQVLWRALGGPSTTYLDVSLVVLAVNADLAVKFLRGSDAVLEDPFALDRASDAQKVGAYFQAALGIVATITNVSAECLDYVERGGVVRTGLVVANAVVSVIDLCLAVALSPPEDELGAVYTGLRVTSVLFLTITRLCRRLKNYDEGAWWDWAGSVAGLLTCVVAAVIAEASKSDVDGGHESAWADFAGAFPDVFAFLGQYPGDPRVLGLKFLVALLGGTASAALLCVAAHKLDQTRASASLRVDDLAQRRLSAGTSVVMLRGAGEPRGTVALWQGETTLGTWRADAFGLWHHRYEGPVSSTDPTFTVEGGGVLVHRPVLSVSVAERLEGSSPRLHCVGSGAPGSQVLVGASVGDLLALDDDGRGFAVPDSGTFSVVSERGVPVIGDALAAQVEAAAATVPISVTSRRAPDLHAEVRPLTAPGTFDIAGVARPGSAVYVGLAEGDAFGCTVGEAATWEFERRETPRSNRFEVRARYGGRESTVSAAVIRSASAGVRLDAQGRPVPGGYSYHLEGLPGTTIGLQTVADGLVEIGRTDDQGVLDIPISDLGEPDPATNPAVLISWVPAWDDGPEERVAYAIDRPGQGRHRGAGTSR